jgi:23S rRNA pseudouridine1911/1915/1917 synthase
MKEEEEEESGEELYEHHQVVVDKGQSFLRIDKFLVDRLPDTSRNRIQVAANNGNILVNNKVVKPNYRVHPEDVISVVLPYPPRVIELIPEDIPLHIAYEDDDLIVVNKQAGLVVHPGYGNYHGTLVNGLIHHFQHLPTKKDQADRPGLVHRLDKNTTGIMVVAKSELALTKLSKYFFDRTIDRTYHALIWGEPEEESGVIEGHIGRSLKNRKVMHVFPDGEYGKEARTHYKILERFGYVTLVECKLETGRTHQIRVHFKHIGHPLFNDSEYGGDKVLRGTTFTKYKRFVENCFDIIPRHALHAKTLGFAHPVTGAPLFFDSELPEDMQMALEKWRAYAVHRQDEELN